MPMVLQPTTSKLLPRWGANEETTGTPPAFDAMSRAQAQAGCNVDFVAHSWWQKESPGNTPTNQKQFIWLSLCDLPIGVYV